MVPRPFKKYYDGKCSHSTCQRQRLKLKAKGSNFGTYTYKQCFKISDFIIETSIKIKVFLMLMATHFYKMMF